MDSAFIHQAANELVQNAGTRNIKQIARSCSLDISETSRIKDMLGLLSLYFDKPLILINRQLDKQTKQMVCGYALGHYLEHQLLMDLHTLNKFLTIKDKHILLYEHNAFTSHLMLDSDEVYQMTKRGLDAAQISVAKRIHLNLVMVKLLELHHLGYDLRHYHAQHHAFIKQFNLPAHFQFWCGRRMSLCSYNPKTRNRRCVKPVHHGFFRVISVFREFHQHSCLRQAASSGRILLLPFSLLLLPWHLLSPFFPPT